jgi:hypothetical protein
MMLDDYPHGYNKYKSAFKTYINNATYKENAYELFTDKKVCNSFKKLDPNDKTVMGSVIIERLRQRGRINDEIRTVYAYDMAQGYRLIAAEEQTPAPIFVLACLSIILPLVSCLFTFVFGNGLIGPIIGSFATLIVYGASLLVILSSVIRFVLYFKER